MLSAHSNDYRLILKQQTVQERDKEKEKKNQKKKKKLYLSIKLDINFWLLFVVRTLCVWYQNHWFLAIEKWEKNYSNKTFDSFEFWCHTTVSKSTSKEENLKQKVMWILTFSNSNEWLNRPIIFNLWTCLFILKTLIWSNKSQQFKRFWCFRCPIIW